LDGDDSTGDGEESVGRRRHRHDLDFTCDCTAFPHLNILMNDVRHMLRMGMHAHLDHRASFDVLMKCKVHVFILQASNKYLNYLYVL
jgi:hypothetical protein